MLKITNGLTLATKFQLCGCEVILGAAANYQTKVYNCAHFWTPGCCRARNIVETEAQNMQKGSQVISQWIINDLFICTSSQCIFLQKLHWQACEQIFSPKNYTRLHSFCHIDIKSFCIPFLHFTFLLQSAESLDSVSDAHSPWSVEEDHRRPLASEKGKSVCEGSSFLTKNLVQIVK